MQQETSVQELHQRLVRGIALTGAERSRLDAWYAQEDAAEQALLDQHRIRPTFAELEAQLAEVATRLREATERIEGLSAQNSQLRQEIVTLQEELARRVAARVA